MFPSQDTVMEDAADAANYEGMPSNYKPEIRPNKSAPSLVPSMSMGLDNLEVVIHQSDRAKVVETKSVSKTFGGPESGGEDPSILKTTFKKMVWNSISMA